MAGNISNCQTEDPGFHCQVPSSQGHSRKPFYGHWAPTSHTIKPSGHQADNPTDHLTITKVRKLHLNFSFNSLQYIKTFRKVVYLWYLVSPIKHCNPPCICRHVTLLNEIRPLLYCYKSQKQNASPRVVVQCCLPSSSKKIHSITLSQINFLQDCSASHSNYLSSQISSSQTSPAQQEIPKGLANQADQLESGR